jgi:recombination protein RecA
MSSAMVSAAAAQSRLFFSTADADPAAANPEVRSFPDHQEHTGTLARFFQSTINNQQSEILAAVTSASHLAVRPAPEMLSSGIAALNALTGGWPRGCLTEICGPASSGRTTLLLAALAAATRRGEFCVLVDASDALDPRSAADAGVDLDRLLWIRCGEELPLRKNSPQRHGGTEQNGNLKPGCPISRASFAREVGILDHTKLKETGFKQNSSRQSDHRLEQVLHVTDLLLESGGFGLVVLDLSDLPPQQARRIPLTTWFRFRRAVENTSTVLLAIEQHPIAGSCSSLQIKLGSEIDQKLSVADQRPVADEKLPVAEVSAAERRKNAAPSASRGSGAERSEAERSEAEEHEAPQERKKLYAAAQTALDFSNPAHAQLLIGLEITAELMRSRLERKPSRSTAAFASKTAWAG